MNKRTSAAFISIVLAATVLSVVAAAQTLRVTIDIKPGDTPTTIEPGRQGVIPVAILTTPTFDAALVDISTVAIGPTGTEAEVFRAMFDDVDGDGDKDRLLLFHQQEMGISCTDKVILLKGKTTDGRTIEGSETVVVECPTVRN
jgi:hypothetical protein